LHQVTHLRLFSHWAGLFLFQILKAYHYQETTVRIRNHKEWNRTRYKEDELNSNASGKGTSVSNGNSRFKATGIFLLDPNAIPDHRFSIADNLLETEPLPLLSTSDPSRGPELSFS
jgi:hypothetical protein